MIFSVKRRVFCFILINLLSFWSTFVSIESHVLRLLIESKLNSSDSNEGSILHFKKLVNTHNLHNPCSPGRHPTDQLKQHLTSIEEITYTELTGLTGTPGNKLGLALLRELITKSTFLQGLATNVIRMNLIEECTELHLPNVANVPHLNQLKNKKLMESMHWLYTSLVNQTAHTFYIWNNQQNYIQHNCSVHRSVNVPLLEHNPRNHSKVLAQHYWTIAVNLRDLMCIFNQVSNAFNIDLKRTEATERVVSHTIADTTVCSRKAVLDCQILKSSIVLLENMSDFLRDQTIQLVTSLNRQT